MTIDSKIQVPGAGFDLASLADEQRLLIEATLRPVQGERFQPTGFPDLGPATFTLPSGTEMLLVESAQSIANRLEAVCWDGDAGDVVTPLRGLPYVRVRELGREGFLTNSILESHRLNSSYILEGQDRSFFERLKNELAALNDRPVDTRLLAKVVFKYDPNALLHGIFLARKELIAGRLKLQRLLGGFTEARDVRPAESGGVKFDRVNPRSNPDRPAAAGFGHVPFHRTEFAAGSIVAYFNLDLAALRGYALGERANALLIALAIWKVRRLLETGLRLRTACDLDCVELVVTRPASFVLPSTKDLDALLPGLIADCGQLFANPHITDVTWIEAKKQPAKAKAGTEEDSDAGADDTGDE